MLCPIVPDIIINNKFICVYEQWRSILGKAIPVIEPQSEDDDELLELTHIAIVMMARIEKAGITPDILMVQHISKNNVSRLSEPKEKFQAALKDALKIETIDRSLQKREELIKQEIRSNLQNWSPNDTNDKSVQIRNKCLNLIEKELEEVPNCNNQSTTTCEESKEIDKEVEEEYSNSELYELIWLT
ncbi:hypothetical protein GLOIN_2v1640480 [Rhizophagus clarus]|uniref:Uncharacterized protein n=1 Tax=Rhizophagus clarus TaxID=94130 RepID=A0A8H3QI31_9GLOM|nr:hypothetical protein GLOIN_2v1640480 [Rhizophagus clarus]